MPHHRADRAADSNADLVVDDFHDLAARLRAASTPQTKSPGVVTGADTLDAG